MAAQPSSPTLMTCSNYQHSPVTGQILQRVHAVVFRARSSTYLAFKEHKGDSMKSICEYCIAIEYQHLRGVTWHCIQSSILHCGRLLQSLHYTCWPLLSVTSLRWISSTCYTGRSQLFHSEGAQLRFPVKVCCMHAQCNTITSDSHLTLSL